MNYPLVYIEWKDSYGCSANWEDIPEELNPEPFICKSVGWLAYDGDEWKVVIPHITGNEKQGCGDMTIPACSIVKVTELVNAPD